METFRIAKVTVKSDYQFRRNSVQELQSCFRHFLNTTAGKLIGNNWIRHNRRHLHPTALLIPDLSKIAPIYNGVGFQETEWITNLHLHGYMIIPIRDVPYGLRSQQLIPDHDMTHKMPGHRAFRVWTERYDFDGRDYDGYIAKSLNRLSDFGDYAFFGYLMKPGGGEDILLNVLCRKSLEVLSDYAGVTLSSEQRALV